MCRQFTYRSRTLALAVSLIAALLHPASAQPVKVDQVELLLRQMTLAEKIGQMTQVDMGALAQPTDVRKYFLGSVLSGGSTDPSDNSPATWLKAVNELKAQALETRLKIPLLYGIDAVHGHNNIDGAVIFPHNIALGATHNPELVERAARVTAEEMAATGIRWAFAPCIAVPQNDRWGRTYEGFGDDPELVSTLGVAATVGLQGKSMNSPSSVLACAKHFIGDGGTLNGIDQGNTVCDEATLRKLYLPPYAAAVKSGVGSVMGSYSSWNGAKMHGNKYLLTDVLKGELGFKGFVVSDWAAIDHLGGDYKADVRASINAGLDMIMIPYGPGHSNNYVEFIKDLTELVNEGAVSQDRIDDAVRRILRVKLQLGLFDTLSGEAPSTATVGSAEHREVARACVRESLVLLKNTNNILPLAKSLKQIAVIGKAADDLGLQCGGWTISWQGSPGKVTSGGTTILAGLRAAASSGTKVTYSADGENLAGADAVIAVIAEQPYAEMKGDRNDLQLPETDRALIQKAKGTGKPVITVLLSGRALVLGDVLTNSDAFVAAWLPGTEGTGVADILLGKYKPTGKLPRNWLRSNEQLNGQPTVSSNPLFPRGYGLSYQ